MKRKIGLIGLTLVLGLSLTACRGTTSVGPEGTLPPDVTENVVTRGMEDTARGVGDVGRGIVNGTGEVIEGVGNGVQDVGNGLQNAVTH